MHWIEAVLVLIMRHRLTIISDQEKCNARSAFKDETQNTLKIAAKKICLLQFHTKKQKFQAACTRQLSYPEKLQIRESGGQK